MRRLIALFFSIFILVGGVMAQQMSDDQVVQYVKEAQRTGKSQNEKMSLVTVISTKGSTPRKAGSKMIVYDSGNIIGTIGGGCAEAKIIKDAALMAGSKNLKIETIDMTGEIAEEEGMVCGGKMTVLIEAI